MCQRHVCQKFIKISTQIRFVHDLQDMSLVAFMKCPYNKTHHHKGSTYSWKVSRLWSHWCQKCRQKQCRYHLTLPTTLTLKKICTCAPKWLPAWFGYANHLTRIACFISYKKWVPSWECQLKAHLPWVCTPQQEDNELKHNILEYLWAPYGLFWGTKIQTTCTY